MDALIPTVLDTDPGIDDALALLLAWGSPELDVLALTVVAGNAPLADTARNAARLVAVRRPARPPRIALGAAAPLRRPLVTVPHDQHGAHGLGDAPDWPSVASLPASPSAAETLVALARVHAERLTLIALGPLTNLAVALRLDADALRRTGRVVMMAGAVDVPGNITPDAEFNAYVDPDAAREVSTPVYELTSYRWTPRAKPRSIATGSTPRWPAAPARSPPSSRRARSKRSVSGVTCTCTILWRWVLPSTRAWRNGSRRGSSWARAGRPGARPALRTAACRTSSTPNASSCCS